MKTRFPSILGVFAAILMVASFVVPMNIAAPAAVTADPGIMKWDTVSTPNSVFGRNDILNFHPAGSTIGRGSEIQDMAVGNDGQTAAFIGRASLGVLNEDLNGVYVNALLVTTNSGITGVVTKELGLLNRTPQFGYSVDIGTGVQRVPVNLYSVAIAPDDPKIIAVTADNTTFANLLITGLANVVAFAGTYGSTINPASGPKSIYITMDGGANWELAYDGSVAPAVLNDGISLNTNETIRDLDISIDYGGKRDIGFVTVDSNATAGRWFTRSSTGFNSWQSQIAQPANAVQPIAAGANYYTLKFSPTYSGDSSVALVYSTAGGTFYNVAYRDLNTNYTLQYAFPGNGIELQNPISGAGSSVKMGNLWNVSLQLPSDFSGQSASLRRAYVSTAANTSQGTGAQTGIYRVDDTTVYVLMDTSTTALKQIYTIAYFGTYASGKLVAGEINGFSCTATVPTWFTDSPTTCPIPCWYPALKPTTGAAGVTCVIDTRSFGAALVGWNADGSLAYAATGSNPAMPWNTPGLPPDVGVGGTGWWVHQLSTPINNDESAFAISRNNGETWNQILGIDTTIDWFNDVAIAPDCTTIYLASVNRNNGIAFMCNEFDSVWRSTINPNVAAPLPAVPPLGTYWERVFTHTTSGSCAVAQSDLPILRVVNSCTDKADGEIVGWAAQGASASSTANFRGGVLAWSPDYGDYWAMITPRYTVQDFAFESSTTLYVLNRDGVVQRMPYTGTSWSTNLPTYETTLLSGHTIAAVPDGKVLVGSAINENYQAAYSADKGVSFVVSTASAVTGNGNEHVIFDVDFKNNSFIYVGDDALGSNAAIGTVYRNTAPSFTRWEDNDMMSAIGGAFYNFNGVNFLNGLNWPAGNNPPHIIGQYGIVQAWTGEPQPALYSAHAVMPLGNSFFANPAVVGPTSLINSAVCRTLVPRNGIPKPGVGWDCLDIFSPLSTTGVAFTLEPSSLKYCGCCTLDTNTTLYAIDNESGGSVQGALTANAMPWVLGGRYWGSSNAVAWAAAQPWIGYAPNYRQGMLWAYTDCLAKKGPILKTPVDKQLVGADPVTGRNQQVDMSWEQLCLTTAYQLQIAKDAAFTLRINPSMNWAIGSFGVIRAVTGSILLEMDATNMTSPAAWIAPGQLPEAGAIYYWRIRSARSATTQIAASPWSEVRSFTVKAGFIVNTPYYGVQLLAPNNGCLGCKVKPAAFSWSPWKEATKYQIDVATDPEFKSLVVTSTTTTTGYEYSGTLNYSTNYFWRVKALEVNGQNIPSDWSATFSLQTEPAPAPPAPPPAEPATPIWVWVIIAIGAILVIVTLVLIFKTRRV